MKGLSEQVAGLRRSPRSLAPSLGQDTTALAWEDADPAGMGTCLRKGSRPGGGERKGQELAGGSTRRGSKFGEIRNPKTFP